MKDLLIVVVLVVSLVFAITSIYLAFFASVAVPVNSKVVNNKAGAGIHAKYI